MLSVVSRIGMRNVAIRTSSRRSRSPAMSTVATTPYLVSPSQLHESLSSGGVSVLDASWFMPNPPRNARDEHNKKRIPGAQFLDLDQVASPHELGLKHMMPTESVFAAACGQWSRLSSHILSLTCTSPLQRGLALNLTHMW
ncbi:hypothetical protein EDD15DRAFT_2275650 [Pisolithus albus]|nr:hypothetical protein EDD15DRAFT_2275650 [Pisolithus albus]